MDLREKRLYHQIHPVKLATDVGVTPVFLFFLWHHRLAPAVIVGFVPPILVSAAMMMWSPNLERMKNSPLGNYISKYMTSIIEAIRLLSLVPMAWGAWIHTLWWIAFGFLILLFAWCNGLILPTWLKPGALLFSKWW